jgi:hypothetical protein
MRGMRYSVKPDGQARTMVEFLDYSSSLRVTGAFFEETSKPNPDLAELSDGPPCLEYLLTLGFPEGTRNDGLFNIGVFLRKALPDQWEDKLEEYNVRFMEPPLKSVEVQGVIKSLKKKSYNYTCERQPCAAHCNLQVCKARKFGISDGAWTWRAGAWS